jgi:hypothetical protein
VIAHILSSMLRIPKGRAPWLTARYLVFDNLRCERFDASDLGQPIAF